MRLLRTLMIWVVVSAAVAALGHAAHADRVALVIGNSAYVNVDPLPNPRRDAEAIAGALERLGFEVDLRVDLDQLGLRHALRDFGLATEQAEVALVFYAGHGLQVAGENYLLPIDARLERERDLLYEAIPLGLVIGEVAQATRLGIVILDACRDNPLADRMRQALGPVRAGLVGSGLARVERMPPDTLVAFSTRPGEVAVDGEGEHSPFTAALLEHIEEPGLEVDLLFRKVRDDVLLRTAQRQEPRTYEALGAEPFYFKPPRRNRLPVLPPQPSLEISEDAEPAPLLAALPTDPDGDSLSVEIAGLPDGGEVLIGDRAVRAGDTLSAQELGRATYRPAEGAVGDVGSFDFVVQDGRGGAVFGWVPITVAPAAAAVEEQIAGAPAAAPIEAVSEPAPRAAAVPRPAEAIEAELDLAARDWRAVQRALNRLGHPAGPEDGIAGPRTREALAAWQRASGENASGYLDGDQLAALQAVAPAPDGTAPDPMAATAPRSAPQLAYVWGHEPETARYVPSALYNRSPDGRITVRRTGTGAYEVSIGSLLGSAGANVQVTGYGPGSDYCNLAGWGEGVAVVRCFAAEGAPRDASFSLLAVRAAPDHPDIAYALVDPPRAAGAATLAEDAHNLAKPVQVARADIGRYALEFGDIAGAGANVQVTTIGSAGERCAIERWTGGQVQVRCTASDGQPADGGFSVLVVRSTESPSAERAGGERFVYLWASNPGETEYRALADYTRGAGQDIRVSRASPGRYVVRLGAVIGERGGNAQVTAYGAGGQYCKVERWYALDIEVRCFDPAGQPADAAFSLLFARAAGD